MGLARLGRLPAALALALALLARAAALDQRHLLPPSEPEDTHQLGPVMEEPGDLLALETTRILTVGANQNQPRPPYAAAAAAAAANNNNNNNSKPAAGLQSPLRLYRLSQSAQATPVFLRQPTSGQDLRLYLYPNPAAPHHQAVGLKVRPAGPNSTRAEPEQPEASQTSEPPATNSSFPSLGAQTSHEDQFERQLGAGQRLAQTGPADWLLRHQAADSLMVTNRSMVSLACDPDDMLLRLKFRQPFRGLVQTTKLEPLESCRLTGTGAHHYEWRLPLNGCGTRQEQPRLFVNNIQIQFHHQQQLDTADDELKTLVCSYPLRPRAPQPPEVPTTTSTRQGGLSERIVEEPQPPVRLVHYEPLVLISGLLLLALTLLGLAAGAYLVTRRHRHRRLRSHSSSSNISSRLYRPPAQLAHLRLAPPLISISKTGRRRPAVDAIQYSQPVSMEPNSPTGIHNEPSSDSLATDRGSVTTIEIPFVKQPRRPEQEVEGDEARISPKSPAPVLKKPKRRTLDTKEREVQVDSGPPRFGSLRATLTSPKEFRRLQDIARLFDEILIEEHVDKGNDKTLVFKTTRLSPSKYKGKILDKLDESERRQVSKLLGQDELFRSLVVESTSLETFRRKLRNSPIYKDLLKPDTWNLLEEILLDPDLTLNASRESINHQQLEPVDQKNNQQELVQFEEKEGSVLAQREILPHTTRLSKTDNKDHHHHHHQAASSPANHYRDDSLEDQSTSKRPKLKSGQNQAQDKEVDGGENQVKRSFVKVRQFNSTKTITSGDGGDGFGSTMINIDSVTNFSTSSSSREGFSTFTRSSIEHNRYHASKSDHSSEDDGDHRL